MAESNRSPSSWGAAFWVVARKELRDGARDKRSMLSMLVFPLMAVLAIVALTSLLSEVRHKAESFELPVVGAEHAPGLERAFSMAGVSWTSFEGDDPEQAVLDGEVEMVLVVDEDFADDIVELEPAALLLYYDGADTDSSGAVGKVSGIVTNYSSEVAALRLLSRGMSPQVVTPVALVRRDVASDQQLAARLLSNVPMFVVMAAFVCGMAMAIDMTAGERERGSLEPLLGNPVPRTAVVAGKWIAGSVFSLGGMAITLLACSITVALVDLEGAGIRFDLGLPESLRILFIAAPLCPLAVALEMMVGTLAKSFKEAQSYMTAVVLLPVLPGMFLAFSPVKTTPALAAIPAFGQQLLINDLVGGTPDGAWMSLLGWASALALTAAFLWVCARLFNSERVLFSK